MRNMSLMQLLVLRALVEMPAGASRSSVERHMSEYTGVTTITGQKRIYDILEEKGYVERRAHGKSHFRNRPVIHYGITDAGLRILAERTLPSDRTMIIRIATVLRERLALRTRATAATKAPAPAQVPAEQQPQRKTRYGYRPLTRREMKAQGLKRWQM